MLIALGFTPNNGGFGVALVEDADIEKARATLREMHNRDDFIRVIILESSGDINIVGNWAAPFNLKTASLDQIAAIMYGE